MNYMVREQHKYSDRWALANDDTQDKAHTVTANVSKGVPYNVLCQRVGCLPSPDGTVKNSQANRVYGVDGKAVNQVANGGAWAPRQDSTPSRWKE